MTGKERVIKAMHCETVDRTPWVPFVGCHGAALIDVTASDYLQSEDLIVQGQEAAIARYQPDGLPVVFDLQVEAEILGCELTWAQDNPPAVTGHVLEGDTTLADLVLPEADQGRLPICLNATRRLREAHPDLAIYGLITGPFTLALHLEGSGIFMTMFEDPDRVHELLEFCGQVSQRLADLYLEAGADIVAVVDPMTSQIGPDQFREFVTPAIKPVFTHIRAAGGLGSFFVCGHAQQNIQAMCECKPDNVSVDENIPLDFVRDICLPRNVSFGGNLQLTTVLLLGTADDAQRNALACMEIGGDKGFLLAPGCDLPYSTPPANLEAVGKLVQDPYQQDVVRTMTETKSDEPALDMREYGQADKVIVDVITLDSEACAPCQYMCEAVRAVAPHFEGIVEWREHKIKYREAVVFMTSLFVKNIPTICIDGRITFVSRIPKRDELIAAIEQRIFEKLRLKIRQKRAWIYVLAEEGDEQADECVENARQAITELGEDITVKLVHDPDTIEGFGVLKDQLPAMILTRNQFKSAGYAPGVGVIKEWLKDLRG